MLYDRLADLPIDLERYRLERRETQVSSEFTRVTTLVVMEGAGHTGVGEDVTYTAEDHDGFPADLPLAGRRSLDELSQLIEPHDLFPGGPPEMGASRDYRRWAFESAALDLGLKQAGRSLADAAGREARPVRFVLSTRAEIGPWLEFDPRLEFKLDPEPTWDEPLIEMLAASGRVRVLDFKAYYTGTPVDMRFLAPRATLTRIAVGFISASSLAPIRPRVELVSGVATTSTSAAASTWSRSASVPANSTSSLTLPEVLTAWMRAPNARISLAVAAPMPP